MTAGIVRGDALRLPLRDASVDLIVTSPPYFALRSYRDGDEHYGGQIGSEATPADFLRALWAVLDECWRVLKPTGSCWVNLGDKYAGSGGHNNSAISSKSSLTGGLRKLQDDEARHQPTASRRTAPDRYNQAADVLPKSVMGLPWRFALGASCPDPYRTVYEPGDHPQWINRRPHVWHKPNGLPESVTDRCRANFEDWFMLTKQGRYFSAVDEIREPHSPVTLADKRLQEPPPYIAPNLGGSGNGKHEGWQMGANPLGKLPGSVWTIPSEPLIIPDAVRDHYRLPDHFAAFPQEWPRRIILGWSPEKVCRDCGRPVQLERDTSTVVRGMRSASNSRVDHGQVGEGAGIAEQSLLQSGLCEPLECAQSSDHEVPPIDDPRLRRSVEADEPDGAEKRVRHGASASDGRAPRPAVAAERGRPPQERSQDGQPDRELGTADEERPRQDAEAATKAVSVPALRRTHSDVRELVACAYCGCREFKPPVILDVFCGTGTVPGVAHALGRTGIGIDLSGDYCRLAQWRTRHSGHFAKTASRTDAERQGALLL